MSAELLLEYVMKGRDYAGETIADGWTIPELKLEK
jgi:hypothetical protein